jgi:hypothetical protein
LDFGNRISVLGFWKFGVMETFAAFVAVWTRAFAAGQKGWLGCAAIEAFIEAGLVAEADVGETHAAGWAVVVGATE